jgi:hypothetical protein
MKKNLLFFILAASLMQGVVQAAVMGFGTAGRAAVALNSAIASGNANEIRAALEKVNASSSDVRNSPAVTQAVASAEQALATLTRGPVIPPVMPVGLTVEVSNAAKAVGDAVKAVQAAGAGLTKAQKDDVNALAGLPILK